MNSATRHIPALRFHWLTKYYDRLVALTMRDIHFKRSLLEIAEIKSEDKVLDFGVGTATLSILLLKTIPSLDLTGLDVDGNVLKMAHQNAEKAQTKLNLVKYDGEKLPFADSSFDRVISSLVFHHLQPSQKEKALSEIYRVLKPSGKLVIADWHKPATHFHAIGFSFVRLLDGFPNTRDHAKGTFPQFLANTGFETIEVNGQYNSILGTVAIFSATKPS